MLKLEFFLAAESFAVDKDSNQLSVFEVVEEIAAQSFPAHLLKAAAIACWNIPAEDRDKDYQAMLSLSLPNGQVDADFGNSRVNFQPTGRRHRVSWRIVGLSFDEPGEYVLRLALNGEHQAEHTIFVYSEAAGEL